MITFIFERIAGHERMVLCSASSHSHSGAQAMTNLISHTFNSTEIAQRADDGYVNATAAFRAAGRKQEEAITRAFHPTHLIQGRAA